MNISFAGRLRCTGSGRIRGDNYARRRTRQAWQNLTQGADHDTANAGQNITRG